MNRLQKVFELWEESWQDGEPEGKKVPGQEIPSEKEVNYNRPEPIRLHFGKSGWNQGGGPSGWNSLEKKVNFVPGKDKDKNKNTRQLAALQDKLHKLEEELASLGEGLVTPDLGTSVLGRSLFTGAALQPPSGFGPNFEPGELAPEEIPPGYKPNTIPDPIAPEEGSGFQHQDVAGTIIAPKQWTPRESKLVDRRSATKRLAEQIGEQIRRKKIRKI